MPPSYTTLCHPNCFGWNGLPPAYPVPLGLFRLKGSNSYITLRQHDFSAERITLLHDNVASWYPRLQRSPSCISLRHHNFPVGRVIQLHYTVPPSFFGWKGQPTTLHCATIIFRLEGSSSYITLCHHHFSVGTVIQLHYIVPPSFFCWKGHPATLHRAIIFFCL